MDLESAAFDASDNTSLIAELGATLGLSVHVPKDGAGANDALGLVRIRPCA